MPEQNGQRFYRTITCSPDRFSVIAFHKKPDAVAFPLAHTPMRGGRKANGR
jgi:hypothetical protein